MQWVALLFFEGWRNACIDEGFGGFWEGVFGAICSDFAAAMLQWVALLFWAGDFDAESTEGRRDAPRGERRGRWG